MRNVIAVILAGGQGQRLSVLAAERAKPAIPFAGKYRIIDFTLSNCVNSGMYYVAVLTQYRPHSLHDHIGVGKPWDLDRMRGGVRLLQPFTRRRDSDWYRGTADAVYQNLPFMGDWNWDLCLVLSGDHVYKMDYTAMIAFHENRRADVTVAVIEAPMAQASRFGTLITDPDGRVSEFEEKPRKPRSNLISMGVYIFERTALERRLEEDATLKESVHDFGRSIIPRMVDVDRVYAYPFRSYWRDVGTIESYWEANMGLLNEPPDIDLYDPHWVIHTRSEERPPARLAPSATVRSSMISHGCVVYGTVTRSVLSPGVLVAEDAVVRDSILMTDTVIGAGSVVDRAILDKHVRVGRGCVIGEGEQGPPNRTEPRNLTTGISVLGKGARIPDGVRLGRNVLIGAEVLEHDFETALNDGRAVPSGATIEVGADLRRMVGRRR